MSSGESFAARWSRLKRSGGETQPEAEAAVTPVRRQDGTATPAGAQEPTPSPEATAREAAFDPASLPSIDSIVAGTDIRAFLQSGVPAELTKAALRRAWSADPAIRDFIGIAENQWDFTDPNSIPGFGLLREGDDLGQLVSQAMGKVPKMLEPEPTASDARPGGATDAAGVASPRPQERPEQLPESGESAVRAQKEEVAAAQHCEPPDALAVRKSHGRAMPKVPEA